MLQATRDVALTLPGVLLTISGDHSKLLGSLLPSTLDIEVSTDLSANRHVELLVLKIIEMVLGQFEHDTEMDDAYVQIVQELVGFVHFCGPL